MKKNKIRESWSPCTDRPRAAELPNGGLFPAAPLVYIFQKEKNEFENFLEKSSYTRILCPKELTFFLNVPVPRGLLRGQSKINNTKSPHIIKFMKYQNTLKIFQLVSVASALSLTVLCVA